MRKNMRKEITYSSVTFGKVTMVNGVPSVSEVQTVETIGNLSAGNKAVDFVKENHGEGFTVFEVTTRTQIFVASVEDFLKIATPVTEEQAQAEQAE